MKIYIFLMMVYLIVNLNAIYACSGIYISDKNVKLFGLNEDFYNGNTIYRTLPGDNSKYGIIGFGHSNSIQAIINEKGLIYDGYGAPNKEVTRNKNLPENNGSFIFEAMISCQSVEEVISLFNKSYHPWLNNSQIFFADRFGNSIIVEGDTILYKEGKFQICTNFYQSDPESGIPMGFYPCRRYSFLEQEMNSNHNYSIEFIKDLLDEVHVENQQSPLGPISTVYSLIIDQNSGQIYIYNKHNFDDVVILDIQEELKKNPQNINLADMFLTSVEIEEQIPGKVQLQQNYPNPFNPTTVIEYNIPQNFRSGLNQHVHTTISVYDLLGREITRLVDKQLLPGRYTVNFDAVNLNSGVYLYCLSSGNFMDTKKMVLIK